MSEQPKPRRSRKTPAEIQALRLVVRGFNALEAMGEDPLRSSLRYVIDRYGKFLRIRSRLGETP